MRILLLAAALTLCFGVSIGRVARSPISISWSAGPALPAARSSAAVVAGSDGRLLLLGGVATTPATVFVLPAQGGGGWTSAAALPQARFGAGAVLLPTGRVIVFGGKNSKVLKDSLSYDPATNATGSIRSLGGPRYAHAFTRDASGQAYAIGGKDDAEQDLATVERYNAFTDRWTTLAPLPEPRSNFPAASDGGDHVFTFGGAVNGAPTAAVYRFTLSTGVWSPAAPMPIATRGSAAVTGANGLIYVIGGFSGTAPVAAVQIYNVANNSWTLGAPLPAALQNASAAIDAQGRIMVIGGLDASGNGLASTWLSAQADAPPTILTLPATSAVVGQPFGYQVRAGGNPPPNYLLTTQPAGMTINGDTGGISWTPTAAQVGPQAVAVKAYNVAGEASQSFTVTVAPPAPTGLAASNVTANSVTLSWNASPGAAGYRIFEGSCGRNGCSYGILRVDGITGTTTTIAGLTAGTTHRYAVTATSPGGGDSPRAIFPIVTTLQPAAPTNLVVANLTQTSVTLSWLPQGSAVPIVGYRIYEFANGQLALAAGDIAGTSGTVNGLQPNTTHLFYVVSYDAVGNQSPFVASVTAKTISTPAPFHTPVFAPPLTEQVVAVIGDRLMVISPELHSAAGADYLVSATNAPQPTFSIVNGPSGMTVDPVTGKVIWSPATGPAGTFTATVRAANSVGFGDFTFSYKVYPAGTDLLAPAEVPYAQVIPSNVTSTSATLRWPASVDNAGVAGYTVFTQTPPFIGCNGCGPGGPIVKAATVGGATTSATLTNLAPSTSYGVWVQAFDAAGNVSFVSSAVKRTFTTLPASTSQALPVASVSAASFSQAGLASEFITAAFGTQLATATAAASGLPLPIALAGTKVTVQDVSGAARPAPLFFVSPTQINYEIPTGTLPGAATVFIQSGDGTLSQGAVQIGAVSPGLFSADATGKGVAAAVILRVTADGTQSFEPIAQFDPAQGGFVFAPIDFGPDLGADSDQLFLILFGTGCRARSSLTAVTLTIGGTSVPVLYAGSQGGFEGLDQINAQLPRTLIGSGVLDLTLAIDGKAANVVQASFK